MDEDEPVEAAMPVSAPTTRAKGAFFLTICLVVITVYVGVPLLILIHTWERALLPAAAITVVVIFLCLFGTVAILRATRGLKTRRTSGEHYSS